MGSIKKINTPGRFSQGYEIMNLLKHKFNTGDFGIIAEIEPPKGTDVSMMVKHATKAKTKVDAFVVPEMTNAVMRMSALGGAMILQGRGMDTVMQISCRDKNRLALQAELLAADACGISNIMAVTGEDPGFGDHHQTKAVYDIELIELLEAIQKLGAGQDMSGAPLTGSPEFLVGSTVNAGFKGQALDLEFAKMDKKAEAGTTFFVTPPLFDITAIEPFLKRVDRQKVRIVPTVLVLKSVGMARYIARNLDHVHIPDELISRIQKAGDKAEECVRIASETIDTLKQEGFSGALISTVGWEDKLPKILEKIK